MFLFDATLLLSRLTIKKQFLFNKRNDVLHCPFGTSLASAEDDQIVGVANKLMAPLL